MRLDLPEGLELVRQLSVDVPRSRRDRAPAEDGLGNISLRFDGVTGLVTRPRSR